MLYCPTDSTIPIQILGIYCIIALGKVDTEPWKSCSQTQMYCTYSTASYSTLHAWSPLHSHHYILPLHSRLYILPLHPTVSWWHRWDSNVCVCMCACVHVCLMYACVCFYERVRQAGGEGSSLCFSGASAEGRCLCFLGTVQVRSQQQ